MGALAGSASPVRARRRRRQAGTRTRALVELNLGFTDGAPWSRARALLAGLTEVCPDYSTKATATADSRYLWPRLARRQQCRHLLSGMTACRPCAIGCTRRDTAHPCGTTFTRAVMGLAWGELGDLRAYASRSDLERQLLQTSPLRVAAPPLRSVLPGDLPGRDPHQSPMRSQGEEPGRSKQPNLEIACSHCTYRANACAYVSIRRGATNWEQPR